MRISQYAYFGILSDNYSPEDISRLVGMAADDSQVKGSRRADPPVPVCHQWKIVVTERNRGIDEQLSEIVARLAPAVTRISRLVGEEECTATLQIVRQYGDQDGEDEGWDPVVTEQGQLMEKLPRQHQLLGWHLGPEVLDFLAATGAELDVDEYG